MIDKEMQGLGQKHEVSPPTSHKCSTSSSSSSETIVRLAFDFKAYNEKTEKGKEKSSCQVAKENNKLLGRKRRCKKTERVVKKKIQRSQSKPGGSKVEILRRSSGRVKTQCKPFTYNELGAWTEENVRQESLLAKTDPIEDIGRDFWYGYKNTDLRRFEPKYGNFGFYPVKHGSAKDAKTRGKQGEHYAVDYKELGELVRGV